MKNAMLTLVGVMLGTGWGWAGAPTMERAAAGGAGILNSAATKLFAVVAGASLSKAATPADASNGNVTAPLPPKPQGPRLDAGQLKKLAELGASLFQSQGHGLLSRWSRPYCVSADNEWNVGPYDVDHCIRIRGKVKGGSLEIEGIEISLPVYMRNLAQSRLAIGRCSIGGDGSLGPWLSYGSKVDFGDGDGVCQGEIKFWLNYGGAH